MLRFASHFYIFLFLFSLTFIYFSCAPSEENKEMSQEELVERGKYLVMAGGCGDCHTPKTFAQGKMDFDNSKLLSGHPSDDLIPVIDTSMVGPGKWILGNGHLTAWVGPWGVSYSANITPDEATGIGTWTEEIFIKAMRTGKHMGAGRDILPPMPYEALGGMKDEDLKAMFAYLKSIPPIKNQVPDPVPPNLIAEKFGKK